MPRYTMKIINSKGEKVRQFSGTRSLVLQVYYASIHESKWKNCKIQWGTAKGRIREVALTAPEGGFLEILSA